VDHLNGKKIHHYALHWSLDDLPYEQQESIILLSIDSIKYKVHVGLVKGKSTFSIVRTDPNSTRGWRSRYYGDKEPAISVSLETDQPRVCFWTFFGFDSDVIKLSGEILEVSSNNWETSINLAEL
jgi:hypothetical protein